MKILKYKNQLVVAMHLLFWTISISAWNIVFNPGVESSGAIKGLQEYWLELLLLDFFFFLYCLMPFVWFIGITRKWIKIGVTALFLLPLFFVLYTYLQPEKNRTDITLFTDFFLSGFMYVLVFHITIAGAVYINLKVFVDKYLKVSKFVSYLFMATLLTISAAILNFVLFDYGFDQLFPSLYFISYFEIWELILIIGSYLLITTVTFLVWQYAVVLIANRDKAQNELSALKAQINPHFLFNNLNTIYSMASRNDEKTKDVILQLSDFLRYVLYDTSSETIPLEKEVEIIRTYVSLQKERVHPEITRIELTTDGNFKSAEIAPLLLLPLAENCFKHGKSINAGSIQIKISFDGKQLEFKTVNNIALVEKSYSEGNGGIGIQNVEKRLELIYPNRHSILFDETEGMFKVEMRIEL
jgi:sensor histidine kinase YesM